MFIVLKPRGVLRRAPAVSGQVARARNRRTCNCGAARHPSEQAHHPHYQPRRQPRPSSERLFRGERESMMVRFAADSPYVTLRLTALRSIDRGAVIDHPEESKSNGSVPDDRASACAVDSCGAFGGSRRESNPPPLNAPAESRRSMPLRPAACEGRLRPPP